MFPAVAAFRGRRFAKAFPPLGTLSPRGGLFLIVTTASPEFKTAAVFPNVVSHRRI